MTQSKESSTYVKTNSDITYNYRTNIKNIKGVGFNMKGKITSLLLVGITCISLLSGCGGKAPATSSVPSDVNKEVTGSKKDEAKVDTAEKKTIKFLSIWPEDKDNSKLILELTEEYKKENPNFNMEFEYIASGDLTSKIKVLLASDDLPDVFAYESGAPLKELIDVGAVADMGESLDKIGMRDSLDEGALDLLESLVDGSGVYALPLGLNIEGIWYNKELFSQAGVTGEPTTWDELIDACEKLKAAGIQPFVAGGKDKWPLTRLINMHLIRNVGPDAMQKVMEKQAKLTDPEYVEAARAIQEMANKGYFGQGITTVDQGTATSMLMNGQGAMFYNGSWMVEDLTSDANAAGEDGIGYFNIPTVAGGKGTLDEYSMNCGNIIAFAADKYDDATAGWVEYVFTRMGDKAMTDYGAFKGYKINNMPSEVSNYTQLVGDHIAGAKGSALWYEARFDTKTSKMAQDLSQLLFNNEMTPEDYMESLQQSIDENIK